MYRYPCPHLKHTIKFVENWWKYNWVSYNIDFIYSVPGIVYWKYFKEILQAVSVVLINIFVWLVGTFIAEEVGNEEGQ